MKTRPELKVGDRVAFIGDGQTRGIVSRASFGWAVYGGWNSRANPAGGSSRAISSAWRRTTAVCSGGSRCIGKGDAQRKPDQALGEAAFLDLTREPDARNRMGRIDAGRASRLVQKTGAHMRRRRRP
jgi:hypothetical protein